MEHNLDDVCEVARFASRDGMDVFYQPIEQNYNTPQDARWYEASQNWPRDTAKAVRTVEELIRLKQQGLSIANTEGQLRVMARYFLDPEGLQRVTQAHVANGRKVTCAATSMLQVQANGDVKVCSRRPYVGNIRQLGIRRIWERRPHYWEAGCCLRE
jgi:MoaA/NifB/PqqE/SkfB family radical SAM enzyme